MALEKRIHQAAAEVLEDEELEGEEEEEEEDDDEDEEEEDEDDYAEDTMVLTPKNNPPPASAPPLNFLTKPTVFDEEDDDEEEDEDEEEEDDPHSPSSSSNLLHTPTTPSSTPSVAAAAAVGNPVPLAFSGPDLKRQEEPSSSSLLITPHPAEKKHSSLDDSRRLFQRLWTDEDEMELLQGFLEYTAHRTTTSHHDTAAFYDQIRSKLQLDFNKNQLVEKLRRLKKKYRNVTARITSGKDFAFKTPHEHATFELSRKIWCNTHPSVSAIVAADNTLDEDDTHPPLPPPTHNNNNIINNTTTTNNNNNSSGICQIADGNMAEGKGVRSRKRPRPPPEKHSLLNHLHSNSVHMGPSFANIVEETVRSCLSPMFKELLQTTVNGGCSIGGCSLGGSGSGSGSGVSLFGGAGIGVSKQTGDERWKKQQILELEVYSKRLELVQEHIQLTLQQLRSGGS